MLIRNKEEAAQAYAVLSKAAYLVVDTETTGLNSFRGDTPFLVVIGDGTLTATYRLPHYVPEVRALLKTCKRFVAHNAKFDMHMLAAIGIEVRCPIWDTMVMARVEYNDHMAYSLDACGERIGHRKDDTVKKWLDMNKAYTVCPETKKKHYYFVRVPSEILIPYAERDVEVTHKLYQAQILAFKEYDRSPVPIHPVVRLEMDTTPILFEMESTGIKLDIDYCRTALKYEQDQLKLNKIRLNKLCGQPFVDSAKFLKPQFDRLNLPYGKTEKGNASFTSDVLEASKDHEFVRSILAFRESEKRAVTYFQGFLRVVGTDDRIHGSIKQSGTTTGRFSASDPNVQNWPADEPGCPYPVRRALVADDGFDLLSIDYAQMELRLMVDEAEETGMIEAILNGKDFHQETADLAGVPRSLAKNGRFAKLYGAGTAKIARTLGISQAAAQKVVDAIDKTSPRTKRYTQKLIEYIKVAPYGYNWLGRRLHYTSKDYAYTYPNGRIQGGCADILRVALQNCHKILAGKRTKLLLPIHDELVFSLASDEHYLVPLLRKAMIDAHTTKKRLPMDVSVAIGKNLYDLEDYHA